MTSEIMFCINWHYLPRDQKTVKLFFSCVLRYATLFKKSICPSVVRPYFTKNNFWALDILEVLRIESEGLSASQWFSQSASVCVHDNYCLSLSLSLLLSLSLSLSLSLFLFPFFLGALVADSRTDLFSASCHATTFSWRQWIKWKLPKSRPQFQNIDDICKLPISCVNAALRIVKNTQGVSFCKLPISSVNAALRIVKIIQGVSFCKLPIALMLPYGLLRSCRVYQFIT